MELVMKPPVLVRGHSRIHAGTDECLLDLVVDAMKPNGWADVDRSTIVVKNCSGYGGSKTYRISAQGMKPADIALHSRNEEVATDELSDPRMEAAANVLSNCGLVPRRLAYGGNWFIEEWSGTGKPEVNSVAMAKVVGEYLAEFHKTPIDWYDSWHERIIERFAKENPDAHDKGHGLDSIPLGSHIWWFTSRQKWLKEMDATKQAEYFSQHFFAPATAAGQRLVTTHGDFHSGNMVKTANGVQSIDLEFCHVTHAASDLGYALNEFHSRELQRTFLESYLVASGFPADDSDVDALFLDASFHALGYHWGIFTPWKFPDVGDKLSEAYKCACDSIRADPSAFLQSKSKFLDYLKEVPEVKAVQIQVEISKNDEKWQLMEPLLVAELKQEPIAKLSWQELAHLHCESDYFTCTCWLYLQPHQRYSEQAIISTGSRGSSHVPMFGGGLGGMHFGFSQHFKFWIDGNTEEPGDEPIDIDLLDSRWHHVALVYNAIEKTSTLYVDGAIRRTTSYLAARKVRFPGIVGAGGSPSQRISMSDYKNRASGDSLLLVNVAGHKDDMYNGLYVQQEQLHCGMPFFKNSNNRYLKKFNCFSVQAGGGGARPDWSFDDRVPDVGEDWCNGGWYEASENEELILGTFMMDNAGKITISCSGVEPEKVGDAGAEMDALTKGGVGHVCFDECFDFPEGQLIDVAVYGRCLSLEEVAQNYDEEASSVRPEPVVVSPSSDLVKIDLETTLTWKEHMEKAEELGGVLPTRLDLILNKVSAGSVDAWMPVVREDNIPGDWVQIGDMNPHPIYQSHLTAHGKVAWGDNNESADWRPNYFYIRRCAGFGLA